MTAELIASLIEKSWTTSCYIIHQYFGHIYRGWLLTLAAEFYLFVP